MRHDERGIALPVAVLILGLVLLLTSIALAAGVRSSRQTVNDMRVKRALQAADAGLNLARSRMNLLNTSATPLSISAPCLTVSQDGLVGTAIGITSSLTSTVGSLLTGMCAPVVDTYSDGAQSSSTIVTTNPSTGGLISGLLSNVFGSLLGVNRTIVSAGTYQGVTRKVAEDVRLTTTTTPTFGDWAISSLDPVGFAATTASDSFGSIRSNGTIALSGRVSVTNGGRPCAGDATPGPQKGMVSLANGATVCGATGPAANLFSLPALATPTSDQDDRITNCVTVIALISDYCPGSGSVREWNPTAKTLRLLRDPSGLFGTLPNLTVRGSTYRFCKLELLGDSTLRVASGAVQIVIDRSLCPAGTTAPGTFTIDGSADIVTDSDTAAAAQIVVVGGGAVSVTSSRAQTFTLYAPDSAARIGGTMTWTGALAAKSVTSTGTGTTLRTDRSVAGISTSNTGYQSSNFRECLVTGGTGPLDGCQGPA